MSEHNLRDVVLIAASDVFRGVRYDAREIAAKLEAMERNLEDQRLIAWAEMIADPGDGEARKKYEKLCRAQGKMATGFKAWRAANAETDE